MSKRNDIINRAYDHIGEDYYSMNYSAPDGYAGSMGTHYVGAGWGCAQFCACCYNTILGTDYVGSVWNYAGDALGQSVNQGGGEFYFVDDPEPGDAVIYIASGYNGRDYDDYGHIALYIGDGMVVGAMGRGTPYTGNYLNIGISETTVAAQSIGGGWRFIRCRRLDEPEPKPEPKEEIVIPKQPETKAKNNNGLKYRAHVQSAGWMPTVRDGQTAGSEGYAKRLEALGITPPEGMALDAYCHVQGIGNLYYDNVKGKGVTIGTTGQARRMEAIRLVVTKWPDALKGKRLRYQGHVQGVGWDKVCSEGQWCGTRGKGKRLEAVRIWIE